jgi:hypothetical protein
MGDRKQIGVYVVKKERFIRAAGLHGQAQKAYFYGPDNEIEDHLAKLEGLFAWFLNEIIRSQSLPPRHTDAHLSLLSFVVSMDRRNLSTVNSIRESMLQVQKMMDDFSAEEKASVDITITHDQAMRLSMLGIKEGVRVMWDLNYKLIRNTTSTPFITSDHPVVLYNQYMEQKGSYVGNGGIGTVGLQLFIPLTPSLMVLIYDSKVYKVGNKKQSIIEISDIKEINVLNTLQVLNCSGAVYFNRNISEEYLKKICLLSKGYNRGDKIAPSQNIKRRADGGWSQLLAVRNIGLRIRLELSFIKFLSFAKAFKLDLTRPYLRDHAAAVREMDRGPKFTPDDFK